MCRSFDSFEEICGYCYTFHLENHIIFISYILILKKFIEWSKSKRVWMVNPSKCSTGQPFSDDLHMTSARVMNSSEHSCTSQYLSPRARPYSCNFSLNDVTTPSPLLSTVRVYIAQQLTERSMTSGLIWRFGTEMRPWQDKTEGSSKTFWKHL